MDEDPNTMVDGVGATAGGAKSRGWDSRGSLRRKRGKMRNGRNEALTSYLTKRPAPPSPFHFVISALAPTSSLNELMLRTFFIAMYKNFDVLGLTGL